MRKKIEWSGLLILLIFALTPFILTNGIQAIWKLVTKEFDTREVTISYKANFDTVYTGAITYLSYKGSKDFVVPEKIVSTRGLPVLCETVFEFKRRNGENCKLFVNLQTNKENNALVRCENRVFLMKACVSKISDNHFMIFAEPSKKLI